MFNGEKRAKTCSKTSSFRDIFCQYKAQLFNFRPHLEGIVIGDNLHEISKLFSGENNKVIFKMMFAKFFCPYLQTVKGKKFLPLTLKGHVHYHILEEFKQFSPIIKEWDI